MFQYGEIMSATHDSMQWEWRFDPMLDVKTFYSFPNWLDFEGRRLLIVTDRKPACWYCKETGHLSEICLGKKGLLKKLDYFLPLATRKANQPSEHRCSFLLGISLLHPSLWDSSGQHREVKRGLVRVVGSSNLQAPSPKRFPRLTLTV